MNHILVLKLIYIFSYSDSVPEKTFIQIFIFMLRYIFSYDISEDRECIFFL